MALRDAFARFLRGRAESHRSDADQGGDDRSAAALDSLAEDVESGDDADLVVLVERLEGFYDPVADEFVPTEVAVEIIEGIDPDEPQGVVRALGDAAPAGDGRTGE